MNKDKGALYVTQKGIIILGIIILLVILLLGLFAEIDKVVRLIWGIEEEVYYQGQDLSGYLPQEVESLIYYQSQEVISYPQQATIDHKTGQIKSEASGEIIDITATLKKIVEAEKNEEIDSTIYRINPYLTKDKLEKINYRVGSYSTIITGREGRRINIKVATKLINNRLILSEEIFSFNKVVGPRTKEKGFAEAPQIVNGQLVPGVGGGICQVSSTLFNALEKKELEVVERHMHSKDVGYVPEGKDATVAWDYLDFKFKNNFNNPIIIKAYINGNRLTVDLLGYQEDQ